MQVKVFNVYKYVPVQIKVCQDRFYDYTQSAVLVDNTTIRVALLPYLGLNAEFLVDGAVPLVSVSEGELPDYTDYAGGSGVLQTFGQNFLGADGVKYQGLLASGLSDSGEETAYNLFYKDGCILLDVAETREGWRWVGTFTVPAHTVVPVYQMDYTENGTLSYAFPYVSGFTESKYLVSKKAMPNNTYFAWAMRCITRVAGTASIYSRQGIFWDNSSNNHGFGITGAQWMIFNGSQHVGGKVEEGKAYWLMLIQDEVGGSQLYYLLDDGTYTAETLPMDVSAWTLAVSVEGKVFDTAGAQLRIGAEYTSPSDYWRGKIDLAASRVDVGSKTIDAETMEKEIMWHDYWRALKG